MLLRLVEPEALHRRHLAITVGARLDARETCLAVADDCALARRNPDLLDCIVAVVDRLVSRCSFGSGRGKPTHGERGGDGGGKNKSFHDFVLLEFAGRDEEISLVLAAARMKKNVV
jgi:hypothetical protein